MMRANQSDAAELRTIWETDNEQVVTFDQTKLPFECVELPLNTLAECAQAIATMRVRGAPLIGAVGAYGLAFAMRQDPSNAAMDAAFDTLIQTRPTAVNLRWALERMRNVLRELPDQARAGAAREQARAICTEDIDRNRRIGEHGLELFRPYLSADKPLQVLTHCNAGRVATVAYGTALAPIYAMAERGLPVHVWVSETRPRNQGASLTAWELDQANIAHTVVVDSAAGLHMMQGQIDLVIVGADRVAANGDVVNKIGTYLKALAAREHGLPFYVALPTSTIDMRSKTGADIPIEQRNVNEVTHIQGFDEANDAIRSVRLVPAESTGNNPAFDITPAQFVTRLITERGSCAASAQAIGALGLDR